MNKRIRRKVAKRITSKIMNYEQLTEFEIKHSFISKDLWNRILNTKEELDKFPISIDLAEGPDMTDHSVVEIQKESKWQKAKVKLKGWFGR